MLMCAPNDSCGYKMVKLNSVACRKNEVLRDYYVLVTELSLYEDIHLGGVGETRGSTSWAIALFC